MGQKTIDKGVGQVVAGLFLASGIVAAACFLGTAIKDFKAADRYVTVKGLVEREVHADLGLWVIKFRVSGDDLATTQEQAAAQKEIVVSFLKDSGIRDEEIKSTFRVIDKKAQEYGQVQADAARFIIEVSTQVRSSDVDVLEAAGQKTEALVKNGVVLADDSCGAGPSYTFTKLNEIKPEMLAEATRNARMAAEQFAADSGSSVGSIRRANQGVFSLTERDSVAENNEGGGGCAPATPNKKVRVVTTIDYFLNK